MKSEKAEVGEVRQLKTDKAEVGEVKRKKVEVQEIGQRTLQFALRIVRLCQVLDEKPGVTRTLSKQILRSGTSVGANVREAQAGQSKPDFISKNAIALKEAHETGYWLELLSEANLVKPELVADLREECNQLVAILTTIVKRARERSEKEKGRREKRR